ncbi:ABC-type lipoprotein release transport system permease subunit [Prosthecobacter fusiformis]|uniref:ABC-type lipoprotein release transport system permease subunit n=1 Tax=Prosthecobacter fusiformis TaxID=48464 RepID=A0A4R7SR05_9BACT|nr:ABC transporter permease [Prosthecobacter fusiformis]TDU81511.1 ABC-type lipoprotein release transport system permease subunit [Prosthecobacter fusiformis]
MSLFSFVLSSARHYWRGHLGLLLGAFLASAILSGSLLVGDSVRASLRRVADLRLGQIQSGVLGGDRWFTQDLAAKSQSTPAIIAIGSAASSNGQVRVNGAQVLGIDPGFWKVSTSGKSIDLKQGQLALNEPLARKLSAKLGDTVLIRLERPSAISRDAPLSGSTNEDVSLRRTVGAIVSAEDFGAFQLVASQVIPDSVFVPLADLQTQIEMDGKVNVILASSPTFASDTAALEKAKTLGDFALKMKRVDAPREEWELSTDRVFMDRSLATKLLTRDSSYGVLTYLVNGFKSAKGATPYSMVTATDKLDVRPNEIIITQWLAEDHGLIIGDKLDIIYYVVGIGRELKEQTATFTVSGILPMDDPNVTRAWTPDFPGVSDVDNCRDWDPGIPMDTKKIRDKDEKYWDDYKGTPKGFISLEDGKKLWANRFGNLTSIRFPNSGQDEAALQAEVVSRLALADIGLTPTDFKGQATAAAKGSVDFGGLFIGLSMFLIAAALIFAALLFLFTLERRSAQVGLLLAMGWTSKMVRRSLLGEAGVLAIIGAVLGVFGGELYTKLALKGLSGAWSGASQGLPLIYSGSAATKAGAGVGAVIVVLLTLWWASRRLFKQQARDLLGSWSADDAAAGQASKQPLWRKLMPFLWLGGAAALMAAGTQATAPEAVAGMFFGSGFLLLMGGLSLARRWMLRSSGLAHSLWQIGVRNVTRRPSRSLAVMGMMAGGIFLVTAVNAFRMSAGDVSNPASGTGGFALIGESSLPIYEDLNTPAGRDAFGLDEELLKGVTIVPFRVRQGDDASCLNLNRAQKPVLVGVDPAKLEGRFSFAGQGAWTGLNEPLQAVADQATAMWGLGLGIGGSLDYLDSSGNPIQVKLHAMLAGSVLQGKMIISEQAFLTTYPDVAGYRSFLIDAPADKRDEVSAHLTRQLEPRGLALQPAKDRLETFMSVQNTYIGIFTVLGGLGVLLGTAGLGILVARHVLERRGELGLMQAVGFQPASLRRLVLGEHVVLLIVGVLLGVLSALLAVWPSLQQGGTSLPLPFLTALITTIILFGILICWIAVSSAVKGKLIESIRRE